VNLVEVLNAMEKSADPLPDDKNAADVKKYFEKVYPDLDFDRVYASDMKKMVKWFDILKKNNIEIVLSEQPEEEVEAEEAEEVAAPVTKEKKTAAKKKDVTAEVTADTPKKTARKKKAE
jgi:phosphoenolpyruvate carboxylase